jgi:hypothetical protein
MSARFARTGLSLVGLLVPAALAAQQPPARALEDQAVAAARAAFSALDQRRWSDVAAQVDSAGLARFRHQVLQRAWSASDFTFRGPKPDPNLPACVADYLKQHEMAPAVPPAFSKEQLLGLDSADELERLAPLALLARYLEWNDEAVRMRRMNPSGPAPRTSRAVLGAVLSGDSSAFVVYSQATYYGLNAGGGDRVSLLQLVRRGAAWKIASPDALTGFTGGILLANATMTGSVLIRARATPDSLGRPAGRLDDRH